MDFVREAEQTLEEVRNAVNGAWVSEKLESIRECAYINITTREGQPYCVRLSWRGFEVNNEPSVTCYDEALVSRW